MIPYEQKDTILHVENLTVKYGDRLILHQVNMLEKDTIREDKTQGQVIAVLGRSGRGKSTLFRALTGLEKPSDGRVLIPDFAKAVSNGRQPAKLVEEGDVGFVNQKYTLFRHKTVYQALWFALRKSKFSAAEKQEEIMHYLKEWGLEPHKDQYPCFLSGGQRQRTAILEQLLSSGFYMVLDEPFSGLDIGNIMSVKKSFELISQRHDLNTIIFSTHDIELAVELADSIYILGYAADDNGQPIQAGTMLRHFDLKKMGLAWHENLTPAHFECIREIRDIMLRA
ncbi:ATP-binding cassette domain-containing protein [Paraflavitalea pollutisoli]|uniref:ATP-binding cassette domain-containing protein n=1 Tax=Paraflavitalea pollutisoli TaxID=3034143 RepID=UPI0023EA8E7F|nr:ATP-binding cassette domain-containing protein [Paraflavitalea sp. H1-2-19X]